MLNSEGKAGFGIFREKVEATGGLRIINQQEYTDRRAIYIEIGYETSRTDIVLTNEFLSDLPAMPAYQSAIDEYVGWLEKRIQNFSPHDFYCKCGRSINVEVWWPSNHLPNRAASWWKVVVSNPRDPSLVARCTVIVTHLVRKDFRGKPFHLLKAIVERFRLGVDENEVKFFTAASHPGTPQEVWIKTEQPTKNVSSEAEVQRFLAEKVYWLGFERGDQRTKVWVGDPWDADYLGVTQQMLIRVAQFLRAQKLIRLDETEEFATAGDLLLQNAAALKTEPIARERIGFV